MNTIPFDSSSVFIGDVWRRCASGVWSSSSPPVCMWSSAAR